LWLKHYILERLQKGARPTFLESMSVFAVSAFWHGFYPSYYLMFLQAAFQQEINKDVYKSWALFYKLIPNARLRYFLGWCFCWCYMSHCGVLFSAMTMENSLFF
jgi:hypothetical protein